MLEYAYIGKHPYRGREWYLRKTLIWCVILVTVCILAIIYYQPYVPPSPALLAIGRSIQSWHSIDISESSNFSLTVETVLEETRAQIKDDLKGLSLSNNNVNISDDILASLVPELGGKPIRNIIVTSWRSGSTFVGDILNAVPGNYYHYEPLLDFGVVTIRQPPATDRAMWYINSLLTCNYSLLDNYLEYGQIHQWMFTHNTRLWEKCLEHPDLCWRHEFLNKFCSLFPFLSMKTVRIRLSLLEQLFDDTNLNIRVLLLVRDPRGTLQSRSHRDWCPPSPDCYDPFYLCADLTEDYATAIRYLKQYPTKFKVMRYEDIAVNPYKEAENILKFFRLKMFPSVKKFLDTHTKTDAGGVSSTYRNSKKAPFHWRYELKFLEVMAIQKKCSRALRAWGYLLAKGPLHLKTFNPVKPNFILDLQKLL